MFDFNAHQYDALREMTAVTQFGGPVSGKQANFAYNADGQLTEIDRYSSSNTCCPVAASTYVYNLANQLVSLLTQDADGTAINAYSYAYNTDGQLTAMTSIDGSIAYTYDHDSQLTSSSGTGLPAGESDSYDAGGNRANTGDSTVANNQLASDGTYHYAYDADGNLITQTTIASGATENFTWDYRNRLTDVVYKTASGTITEQIHYTYDALNRRISQSIDPTGSGTYSQVEYYIYDGSNLLLTLNGSGSPTHIFLNGPAANMTLADDAVGGNVSWMLADQQGTVRDVIDGSGNQLDHIQYDSYGNILSQSNPLNQPRFGYAGMILDSSTGLYYDNARFYDPRQGRFISQDPSGFAGGNTNLYGYVNNSPTNFIDPTGLSPKGKAIAVASLMYQVGKYQLVSALTNLVNFIGPIGIYGDPYNVGAATLIALPMDPTAPVFTTLINPVNEFLLQLTGGYLEVAAGPEVMKWTFGGVPDPTNSWSYNARIAGRALGGAQATMELIGGVLEAASVGTGGAIGGSVVGPEGTVVGGTIGALTGVVPIALGAYGLRNLYVLPPVMHPTSAANAGGGAATGVTKPSVTDPKLNNLVEDLYKGTNTPNQIGTGSTADAVRNELQTGQPTYGTFHSQKGQQYVNALTNWLARNPNASPTDIAAARQMLNDLNAALAGN